MSWNRKWVKWIIYLIFETWLIYVSQERVVVWTWLTPHFDEKTHIFIVIFKVEAIFWNRKWVKWIIYLFFETWLITVSQERLVVWTSLTPHFDEKTHIFNINFKAGANIRNRKWLKMNNLCNICVRQTDRQSERLAERQTHLEMTLF